MSFKKRRLQEKEDMKNLILNASIKIINDNGYDMLSMRKIANVIEYSPTTLYLYYKNKAQIAEDIGIRISEKIIMDITEILSKQDNLTIKEKLEQSFKQFILSMTSNPEMGKAFIRSGSNVMFKIKADEKTGENLLQTLLIEGHTQGIIKEVDSNSSWMILTALIGFGMNSIENQLYLLDNWEDLIESFVSILMNGIAKEN
ncbi:MAG: TetR/AcrR family transcriptional regulator [Clostridium sp.]|jgi:AcrR family transcriptional regulator|uniref:TetR/AcrR family transcriptional regulator n=1 Tax=Clostridium sp. TaxID=1506 RepID=UPI0025C1CDDC|nr:TetR/AcrR family transcriptional regulator [Clostridium sp.]MCH3963421.1 TetR/AcrR family transcriptional regulator [Clostridium sp.]MCI1716711.1 TetR/AcrR family transcriptional regulator [Clostridium sp.]MCI1801105.1 TetR/AcrR family transcriptional regulator [Clostridium sp.]MCI1814897.1 TetR/AcrR family transcriptional regulator [Clostridium sp.]MCI1871798.1 TetR/AcrR family transcriptional regulator [Clostridium sp.]